MSDNSRAKNSKLYDSLESLTRQAWFYVAIFLSSFIPPWSSVKVRSFSELVELVRYVAEFLIAKKLVLVPLMPYFHLAMLVLFGALLIWRNRFGRVFSVIVGLHFLVVLFMQTGAVTERYGLVFYPNAFILIFGIALAWFWEASLGKTDFTFKRLQSRQFLLVAAAVFSFWNPDRAGDYRLALFLTSTSPIAFCMITTIYLALLCLLYPRVNLPLFRLASFVSILIGIVTLGMGFFMDPPARGRYWSLLHTPMVAVAVYSFVLSLRKAAPQPAKGLADRALAG